MNGFDIPDDHIPQRGNRMSGLGDFVDPLRNRVLPASSMPMPPGPANFPIKPADGDPGTPALLQSILGELKAQNMASTAVIRGKIANPEATLDWHSAGTMDRLMIRNSGPDTVYFAFDRNGEAVEASVGNESWALQAQESVNLTHTSFQKIGLKCAGGGSASVNAIGWQSVAGNQAASIN